MIDLHPGGAVDVEFAKADSFGVFLTTKEAHVLELMAKSTS